MTKVTDEPTNGEPTDPTPPGPTLEKEPPACSDESPCQSVDGKEHCCVEKSTLKVGGADPLA